MANDNDKEKKTDDGHTGHAGYHMSLTTGFRGNRTFRFSAETERGAHEAVNAVISAMKPDDIFHSFSITLSNGDEFMDTNSKRKRLTLDHDDEADYKARKAARQVREAALLQQGNQQNSGQGSGQDQGPSDDDPDRRIRCVGCKSDKHTLAVCLKAGADGYMKGCPFCNTMDHSAGNCPHPALKGNKLLRLRHFVFDRRNMPSFLNVKAWYPLVEKHARSREAHDGYPWTPEFTKSIAGRINEIQHKVDENGPGGARLPVDPSVRGWPAVVAYRERLKRQEKEKALAEARAKAAHLSDLQKAAAAFMSSSLVPLTRPDEPPLPPKKQSAAPARFKSELAPEAVSEHLGPPKEQHDVSQLPPWLEIDSDDDDDDDDDEEEDFSRWRLKQREAEAEAAKRAIRAKGPSP